MNINHAENSTITTRGQTVSRADVLRTIEHCDALGKDTFLARYGFQDSVRYHLRHSGRSYPSKAILGVTLKLTHDRFFGGAADTVPLLGQLGFHVRNSETGEVVDTLGLAKIRDDMIAAGWDDPVPDWNRLPVSPSAYFLSGSNRAPEIAALGKVGADIGVTAPEIAEASIRELEQLAGSDVLVFVDSGAFGEVRFEAGELVVHKPITDSDWQKILGLYDRLAISLGSQLTVVAPDRVGCQTETLNRLTRYADRVAQLQATGARVLVAVQKGELSQAEFAKQVDVALGNSRWIPALPCKKAATTADEVGQFLTERAPWHVHLLGLGVGNRQVQQYLTPFASSSASVSLDSCWITANVGRQGKRRRHTKACDYAEAALQAAGRSSVDLKVQAALYAAFTPKTVAAEWAIAA